MHLYTLEEIILEKLRAILQHTKKLHERDWARSRARDYYDLGRIFGMFEKGINLKLIKENLSQKCSYKEVSFQKPADFFDEKMIAYVSKTWKQWLGPLVTNLPDPQNVFEELKTKISLCLP